MKNFIAFTLPLLIVAVTHPMWAQEKFGFELRSGASFAVQELGDADLNTGLGFEGIFDYRFTPHLGAYVGWGWNHFAAEQSFAGTDIDFEETGYMFGLEFNHPIGASSLAYYIRGGGIYNHIETENKDGDITADSGHGIGWQVGAGVDIALGSKWHIKPGVKYQSLSRELKVESVTTDVDLKYASVGLGIAFRF
ncbi:MAG: outer membrane beta-barrel protein [Saprospiraceae bacterium]|nr:outer membrane beta-barrel protein [Saprospiraceae bacterium]